MHKCPAVAGQLMVLDRGHFSPAQLEAAANDPAKTRYQLRHSRHAPGNGSGIPAGVVHETKRVSCLVGSSTCSRARSFSTSGSQHHMGFVALHACAWPFKLRSNLRWRAHVE